jgi:hypothetical protein
MLRRIAIGAVLLVVAGLGLEGASSLWMLVAEARALEPPPENFRQAAYDSLVGWVGMPNLSIRDNYGPGIPLTTDARGLRIHRPVAAPAAGERAILCSGDSFTFGSGVGDADTFCARLEQEMPGVRTINLSQRGYGNDQMYLRYKRDGARYPHQIHLFGFIWNDFERMTMTSFFGYPKPVLRVRDGQLVAENVPVPQWEGWSRLTASASLIPRSRLMQLVRGRVDLSDSARLARVDAQVWGPMEAIFRDLGRLGKERGSAQVLVYLPAPNDITPGAYDARRVKLAALSRQTGLPLIDLTEEMRKLPADTLEWMFITANALPVRGSALHYTPKGHAWVAARLAAHLRAMPEAAPAPAAASAAASAPTAMSPVAP